MFKNILIPTDGSPQSQKAAAQGVALAKAIGARVTAFFAAPPATPIVYRNNLPVGFTHAGRARGDDRADGRQVSRSSSNSAAQEGRRALRRRARSPATIRPTSILEIAKKKKCDLIVMATHGQRGLRGVLDRQRRAEGAQPIENSGDGRPLIDQAHQDVPRTIAVRSIASRERVTKGYEDQASGPGPSGSSQRAAMSD